ncbi:MAG: methyl-accepting chemotaxis protein [Phycisphaerae bacterium]
MNMSLRAKLLLIGVGLTIGPLIVLGVVVYRQGQATTRIATEESTRLAYADLDHIAEGVYAMCKAQQELLDKKVADSLNVAQKVVTDAGGVNFSDEKVNWSAKNQYTGATQRVALPRMHVGETWLGQISEPKTPAPVVDEVQDLVSSTCTVFQRMNQRGDMLRVSTNVIKTDGTRATGTYIPAVNPDGTANPVLSKVLGGERFVGRAYVVNKWYITAYEPLRDKEGNIVGVLYVGIPQESAKSLRQAIMDIKVGETGYVFVLDSKGNYVVSKGGKRDGECIMAAKDAEGNAFVEQMISKATKLGEGEYAEQQYHWKNPGDEVARNKITRLTYFRDWDWVIGAGSYEDEFHRARQNIEAEGRTSNMILLGVSAVSVVLAIVIWWVVSSRLAGRIGKVVTALTGGAEQVASAAQQVSSSSESLASGASEQAAGMQETTASVEEITSMIKQNASNAGEAKGIADEANANAKRGSEAMDRMSTAIGDIKQSSDETAKIIKTIDEIAFQTNLLALNAAVEAARAGEAGKGFAVVAEEVRNLAMRSAEAARNTAGMIETAVKNADNGVNISQEVADALTAIAGGAEKVNGLVAEIAAASGEQAEGIEQINTAIAQVDQVTQSTAASAEESASASEELSAQAEELMSMVDNLETIVRGRSNRQASGPAEHFRPDRQERSTSRPRTQKLAPKQREKKPMPRQQEPEEAIPFTDSDVGKF